MPRAGACRIHSDGAHCTATHRELHHACLTSNTVHHLSPFAFHISLWGVIPCKHREILKFLAGTRRVQTDVAVCNNGSRHSVVSQLGVFGLLVKVNPSCCSPCPRTTPFPEEKSILGVTYGVLLWADMNAATPLGACLAFWS
jgi:hypothetical protein